MILILFTFHLRSLWQDHWYKQAARLTSYLVSPIHDAAAKGNNKGLEELILTQKEPIDTQDNAQNTPLHYAAAAGHVETVKWLLDNGANINALNLLGDTALHRVRLHRTSLGDHFR
jgi:ankyrin repeat protein